MKLNGYSSGQSGYDKVLSFTSSPLGAIMPELTVRFLLLSCAKCEPQFRNVNKAQLWNDGTSTEWCYATIKVFSPLTSSHSTEHVGGCSKFNRGHLHGKNCSNQNVTSLERLLFSIGYIYQSLRKAMLPLHHFLCFLHCNFYSIFLSGPLNKKYPQLLFCKTGCIPLDAVFICHLHSCNFKVNGNAAPVVWHGSCWLVAPL